MLGWTISGAVLGIAAFGTMHLCLYRIDSLFLAVLLHGFELHEASHVSRVARDAIEGQLEDGRGLQVLHELHGAVHEVEEAEKDGPDGRRVPAGVCEGGTMSATG